MARPNGFYWVKLGGEWTVAELQQKDPYPYSHPWAVIGDDRGWADRDFDEIGEQVAATIEQPVKP